MDQAVSPMELLKEEMENDEIALRINAIHRLRIVATILGPEGIKNQLLPYLDQLIKKEEDEVLFAIAEELGSLGSLLPGNQTQLLPILENLAGQEETVVREMSVKSLISISQQLSDQEIASSFIPLILRLAQNENNFTCRVSAVNLMCPIQPRAGQLKEKIRQKFSELCGEETPMVRRAVAMKIGELANCVEKDHVINDLIPLFRQLTTDDQDQIRSLCLESLKQLAKMLNKDENKTQTLPVIIQATEDKSWRVRLQLAKSFAELAEAFGKEIADGSLVQIYTQLLKDVENDVRVAAVQSLGKFIKMVSVEKLQFLIPTIQNLARDTVPIVRAGTAEVLSGIVGLMPKETSAQKLLPNLIELFNDENQEVRQGAARAACMFAEAIGPEILLNLNGPIGQLIKDQKWRVRVEALITVSDLAEYFHDVGIFQKYLESLFLSFLKDRASAVRDLGVERLKKVVDVLGQDWVFSSLMPKLNEQLNKENGYLFRITALSCLEGIASRVNPESSAEKIFPVIFKNLKDPVPNVRFVCIKILKNLVKIYKQHKFDNPQIMNTIKQNLTDLLEDQDVDVKYFAQDAVQTI